MRVVALVVRTTERATVDDINQLRERAKRWRRMIRYIDDAMAIKALKDLAESLEETIAQLESQLSGAMEGEARPKKPDEPDAQVDAGEGCKLN
jgi:predicted  nucleic acid-binding Zn-ribbon protein